MAKLKQTRVAKLVRGVQDKAYQHSLRLFDTYSSGKEHYAKVKVDSSTPMRKRISEQTQARNNEKRKKIAASIRHQRAGIRRGPFATHSISRGGASADRHNVYAMR